ncbi:hypothetical protein [Pseudosulfitobacter sp. DSM 107133]|uniref:hypothetical protein n=1 Tax=Pseudosulfitobacter sp. DSM 107133 TaxID=2883100 RepID=UPI000DF4C83D|nr:hypothetical protein [Pseudosulfitobacter sp. DSM 107133]UOA27690.1 hypothetical protein DSM107133_02420 [Pseudosulfitobacter sp. DSM 107133]
MSDYIYQRSGRRPVTLITLVTIWILLAVAMVRFDASVWVVWIGALATLPALYDLVTARVSLLRLTDAVLNWQSGKRNGSVTLQDIKTVRLDTRLDLSIKATLVLHTGSRLRLPLDVVPPAQAFEDALRARGVAVERHHFRLVG